MGIGAKLTPILLSLLVFLDGSVHAQKEKLVVACSSMAALEETYREFAENLHPRKPYPTVEGYGVHYRVSEGPDAKRRDLQAGRFHRFKLCERAGRERIH